MASTFKWVAPESTASALTTELNSLANGSYSNASSAIDNETDLYEYISLELALASLNPTGSPYVAVYAVYSVDGTNYDDGGGATAPPAGTLLTTFDISTGSATKRRTRTGLVLAPLKFKLIVLNGTAVSFAASANTLKYRRYNEQSV
jgi:hypothetical protein